MRTADDFTRTAVDFTRTPLTVTRTAGWLYIRQLTTGGQQETVREQQATAKMTV